MFEILEQKEPWAGIRPIDVAFAIRQGKRLELPAVHPQKWLNLFLVIYSVI